MNLLTSKGWRGFLGGGKITRFVSWRKTDFPANRKKIFHHGGREGLENRDLWAKSREDLGWLPEQSPGGWITVWYVSAVFRQPYPKSNTRGRVLLDLKSPLGQIGRWLRDISEHWGLRTSCLGNACESRWSWCDWGGEILKRTEGQCGRHVWLSPQYLLTLPPC